MSFLKKLFGIPTGKHNNYVNGLNAEIKYNPSPIYDKHKKVTVLAKEGKMDEAITMLKELKSEMDEEGGYTIERYLRLPMYLQKAGRNDEAWKEFNLLLSEEQHIDEQALIYDKMRLFLQREKRYKEAVKMGLFTFLLNAQSLYQMDKEYDENRLDDYISEDSINDVVSDLLKKENLGKYSNEVKNLIHWQIDNLPNIDLSDFSKELRNIFGKQG